MPAHRRARRVPRHQRLDELVPTHAAEHGTHVAQRAEPVREWLGGVDGSRVELVVDAEVRHRPARLVAVETNLGKLDPLDLAEERELLVSGDEIGLVCEAVGAGTEPDAATWLRQITDGLRVALRLLLPNSPNAQQSFVQQVQNAARTVLIRRSRCVGEHPSRSDDDLIDQAAMESFPASDPLGYRSASIGGPSRDEVPAGAVLIDSGRA